MLAMSKPQAIAARLTTALLALVAMVLSYHALALRAGAAGIVWPLAWLYPLVIDGLLVVGMLAAYVLRRAKPPTRAYVWAVIALGLSVSLLGNALPALDPLTFTIRAMPPLALALSLHLLIILNRPERHARAGRRAPEQSQPEQEPSIDVLALPTVNGNGGSGSAKARALLAEHPELSNAEVAERAGVSVSRVRAVRAMTIRASNVARSGVDSEQP